MIDSKVKHKDLSLSTKKFIKHVRKHLAEYGMSLVWGRGDTVHCGGYTSSAYFCEGEKMIRVARKNALWLESLVHEYGHFTQWLDGSKIYKKSDRAIINIDKWFNRETVGKVRLSKSFRTVREMERDCEIKSCRIARKFKLPIRSNGYARRANIYIYSHWIMEEKQKFWAYSREPMHSKYILSLVPNNFRTHTHKTIPVNIYKALSKYV